MDNLASRKVAGVREAIEAARPKLLFLSAYSPDFNPIEMAFSKLKVLLRAAASRTAGDLWQNVAAALTPRRMSQLLHRRRIRRHLIGNCSRFRTHCALRPPVPQQPPTDLVAISDMRKAGAGLLRLGDDPELVGDAPTPPSIPPRDDLDPAVQHRPYERSYNRS